MKQIVRQLDILRTLQANRFGVTVTELAKKYGVTVRTVQRDLNDLRDLEFIILAKEHRDKRVYYKLFKETGMPLNVPVMEVAAMIFAERAGLGLVGTPFGEHLRSAVRRLTTTMPEDMRRFLERAAEAYVPLARGHKPYEEARELLETLNKAILERRVCRVSYRPPWEEAARKYEIEPLRLLHHRGGLYVISRVPYYIELLARVAETLAPGMSAEKCLQTLGLAEFAAGSLRLRAAALLLFSSDMGRWHPRSEIRIQQVAGAELLTGADYNVIRDETFSGNVLELLSEGWEFIRQFLVQKRLAGGSFQLQTSYPEDACREALVNAVAHRDYSIEGRSIEVLVFNDRLEIRNPGRLLSTVKLAELRQGSGVHDSRNTYVARVLRELGYMQEMGEGIRRINALLNGHELAPPDIDSVDHSFVMTFSQRNIFSPSEQKWLDAFAEFNLSREEKLIVLLGRGGKLISTNQVWEALDIVDTEEYRRVVAQLQTKGLFSSTIGRRDAASAARRKGIGPREVPRFAIRTPDIARRDQREVVDALIAIGPQNQIGRGHYEQIRDNLSGQNIFRGTVKIRELFRWLELVEPGGAPTERLGSLWTSGGDAPGERDGEGPDVAEQRQSASVAPAKDIYVGNLDPDTSEQEIRELFETVGTVVSVTMPKDYLTRKNRGYAFVWMSDPTTSQEAFEKIEGRLLRNRPVKLGWSFR